jgi:cytochrome c peroxidase
MFVFFLFSDGSVKAEERDIKRHSEKSLFKLTENKLFSIELMITEKELRKGAKKVEIIVYDRGGNDVEDAEIKIAPRMPETNKGLSNEPVVFEKGGGFYEVDNVILDMTSHWELRIAVKKYGVEDAVRFDFPGEKVVIEETKSVAEEEKVVVKGEKVVLEGEKVVVGEEKVAVEEEKVVVEEEEAAAEKMEVSETEEAVVVDKYEKYKTILKPLPAISPIPADNPMTPDKIRLGKMLYWDRRVSKTGATSCVFCHYPSYYGAEPMRKSVGIEGEIHLRNAQTVLNSAFLSALFWAGESPTLEHQALSAVKSHVAMRSVPDEVAERLNRIPEYRELSIKVFGELLTGENIGKAMAAFMRTLTTPNYPLARWLQGDEHALTENQKTGMALFADKGCIGCHNGPVFSDPTHDPQIQVHALEHPEAQTLGLHLHKVIVPGAENDLGRAQKTSREEDKYFFKVPSLLNVAKTPPYTHAGLIDSLHDMVNFMAKEMLDIELSPSEADDIVAFLHALTGEIPGDFMSVPPLPTGGGEGDFGPELLPSGKNSGVSGAPPETLNEGEGTSPLH